MRARITLLYLFDVAEGVALSRLASMFGAATPDSRIAPQPAVEYQNPPLSFDGATVGAPLVEGMAARVRVYDYGVVSLAFTRSFEGSWDELVALGARLIDSVSLDAEAERCCRAVVDRVAAALERPRETFLFEDYAVFATTPLPDASADTLVAAHGTDIARLLRGEAGTLSRQEVEEVLRHRLSYLTNDLFVPTWNAAFICDGDAGIDAVVEVLEFGNSQLLQFRYYDHRLDSELVRTYADLQSERGAYLRGSRRYTRAARRIHAHAIDVRELVDRTENALKFVGDIYLARVFALAGARLGLERWKGQVRDKLQTLDSIHHFAVEQSGIVRGELLELTIIAILVLELVLFFLGIMK